VDSDEEPEDYWGYEEKEKKSKKHNISKNWLSNKNKLMETTSVQLSFSIFSAGFLLLWPSRRNYIQCRSKFIYVPAIP
jgi:hypothetical protein